MASPPIDSPLSPPLQADRESPAPATGPGHTTGRRASRRGAARRFRCEFEGCGKIYTRAEHLQRHQLNHNPREIFECTEEGCGHSFVRADLLSRHKTRHHSASYVPRHRVRSFSTPQQTGANASSSAQALTPATGHGPSSPGTEASARPPPGSSGMAVVSPTTSSSDPGRLPLGPPPGLHQGHPKHHSHDPQRAQQQQPHQLPPHRHHPEPPLHIKSGHVSPPVPHDAAVLLTPESSAAQPSSGTMANPLHNPYPHPARLLQSQSWTQPVAEMTASNMLRHQKAAQAAYYQQEMLAAPTPAMPHWGFPPEDVMNRDNFTMWLFDAQVGEFNVGNIPFLEGGLESPFNNNIPYDYESITSRSQLETPPRLIETDELLQEFRRQEVLRWFLAFRRKYPKLEPLVQNLVMVDNTVEVPALSLEVMRDCLREYWEHVSARLPIIHQPTFSINRCSTLLLLAMIGLGAASLRGRAGSGTWADNGGFADVIIHGLRWEILTSEEATPPVSLAVAQSLLLVELYEKMFSSRKLHERAHIYHSATLTLLRRGSPLIGRSGNDTPPEQPADGARQPDPRTDWVRWAETEAMHRVVFAAFMMDVIHAAMFGHAANMAPHEIRLNLPCDDNLWTATTVEEKVQLEGNFRMYGVRPILFLDGLKRAVHGKEVRTHSFGRMVIMSGLLSVGWHLNHRESHLKGLDLGTPSGEMRDNWRKTLLVAFDQWKESFDNGTSEAPTNLNRPQSDANGPIQSAAVLYHLAQISLHVDIIDIQVYAGAKQLLGQKVSERDYKNVVTRMTSWAQFPSTRHAVLHAFKLLHCVLVQQRRAERRRVTIAAPGPNAGEGLVLAPLQISTYSCRSEPDPHRPWIMYYATLSIWAFVRALRNRNMSGGASSSSSAPPSAGSHPQQHTHQQPHHQQQHYSQPQASASAPQRQSHFNNRPPHHLHSILTSPHSPMGYNPVTNYNNVVAYLSKVANLSALHEQDTDGLEGGLPDLLECLHHILAQAHSELLKEACERLVICKSVLLGGAS